MLAAASASTTPSLRLYACVAGIKRGKYVCLCWRMQLVSLTATGCGNSCIQWSGPKRLPPSALCANFLLAFQLDESSDETSLANMVSGKMSSVNCRCCTCWEIGTYFLQSNKNRRNNWGNLTLFLFDLMTLSEVKKIFAYRGRGCPLSCIINRLVYFW